MTAHDTDGAKRDRAVARTRTRRLDAMLGTLGALANRYWQADCQVEAQEEVRSRTKLSRQAVGAYS